MLSVKVKKKFTCSSFRKELNALLITNGIKPTRISFLSENRPGKKWTLPADDIRQKVGKVVMYMENHLSEELSLEVLANETDLSKYQLIRGFQKEKGTTPWKFLINRRIEAVKKFLEEGISPGQAAVEAGFYDQSHLTKVFRETTDLTPKEYQEKNFKNRN